MLEAIRFGHIKPSFLGNRQGRIKISCNFKFLLKPPISINRLKEG